MVLTSAYTNHYVRLPLCWKAFSQYTTPNQQNWANSVQKSLSNHLLVICRRLLICWRFHSTTVNINCTYLAAIYLFIFHSFHAYKNLSYFYHQGFLIQCFLLV